MHKKQLVSMDINENKELRINVKNCLYSKVHYLNSNFKTHTTTLESKYLDIGLFYKVPYFQIECDSEFTIFYFFNNYQMKNSPFTTTFVFSIEKTVNKKYLNIKFQHTYPNEICKFELSALSTFTENIDNSSYSSSCGNTDYGSHCFHLCQDVMMEVPNGENDKNIFDIKITRAKNLVDNSFYHSKHLSIFIIY